jgi:beta-glucosidase
VALARRSDVAVVVVGTDKDYEGEELDPPDLHLPGDQETLIRAVAAANKNTVVVLNDGTPVLMDWLRSVPALLEPWYAGQETGTAVADILFGDVNPSGKLPLTFAARRQDYPDWGHYPGTPEAVHYAEGLYVGYRHFDTHRVRPLFPFGYGLSYTSFGYGGLEAPATARPGRPVPVAVSVRNTGRRAGDEVVQLYVRPLAPRVDRPVRELKGFRRVSLRPGQTARVTFALDDRAFSYWDDARHAWRADPGRYMVEVGASSRDIRARAVVERE